MRFEDHCLEQAQWHLDRAREYLCGNPEDHYMADMDQARILVKLLPMMIMLQLFVPQPHNQDEEENCVAKTITRELSLK